MDADLVRRIDTTGPFQSPQTKPAVPDHGWVGPPIRCGPAGLGEALLGVLRVGQRLGQRPVGPLITPDRRGICA
jgi:hypothetical protein